MAQIQKLEQQTKLKSSPDRLFDVYTNQTHLIPQICPDKVRSIKVIEGDGKSVGSVAEWNYFLGKQVMAKCKIVAIDKKNNKITLEVIDGEVKNYFKSFQSTLQTITEDNTNFVKWTLEYEKINDNMPTPNGMIDLGIKISEEVDSYLFKA